MTTCIKTPKRTISREVVRINVLAPLTVDAWIESRGRLAQLLDPKDFSMLADYYGALQVLVQRSADPSGSVAMGIAI